MHKFITTLVLTAATALAVTVKDEGVVGIVKQKVSDAAAQDDVDLLPSVEFEFDDDLDLLPGVEFDFEQDYDFDDGHFDEFEIDAPVEGLNLAQVGKQSDYHVEGVDYPFPKHYSTSQNSRTYDNSRGGWTVYWYDAVNIKHKIQFNRHGQSATVRFPIANGSWNWVNGKNQWERTGFNQNIEWVSANFSAKDQRCSWWQGGCQSGKYVRIEAAGYYEKNKENGGLWGEVQERSQEILDLANGVTDLAIKMKTGVSVKPRK